MKRFGIWSAVSRISTRVCSIDSLVILKTVTLKVRFRWHTLLLLSAVMGFAPSVATASVVISEFMAANDTTLLDEDGDTEDWIELHNSGASAVNLQGWYLSDDEDDQIKWQFPSTVLQADQYIVIFASNKERAVSGAELHTNFKLSAGGEYLALTRPDGITIATEFAPEYPEQFDDISYGGNTYFPIPSPGATNNEGVTDLEGSIEFSLDHGFFDQTQTLEISSNLPNGDIRYTLDGSTPPIDTGCDAPSDGKPWAYEYYQGTWTSLPDFDTLTALESGTTDNVSTDVRQRDNNFALRFRGCVAALADGLYTFTTSSDDGSQLFVDGELVVDNPAAGSVATVSGEIALDEGLHEVVITYYQSTGDHELTAQWAAPMRGQTYAVVPEEGNEYPADADSENYVELEFDLPADGQFRINPSVQGADAGADSFWVQLDDGPLWLYQFSASAGFSTVSLNNSGSEITPTLSSGEHKIKFFVREDGARLDSITVASISCDGPCQTQVIEAEIEEISGDYVLGGIDSEIIPAKSWFTYSSPIQLNATSMVRAVAIQENFQPSSVQTQSYIFLDDVLLQSPNEESPAGWPSGNINGQDLDYGMDPDIVNPNPSAVKSSILSLPSISLVTDLDNLLHPEIGIYVNAEEKGRYWERPASIELIDPNGEEPGFTIDAGIRIRGGFSRRDANPKHPFRLYFRGSYGGDLDYPLFGEEGVDSFKRMDLRSPNNYNWASRGDHRNTFLREVWSRDTQAAMGHAHTRSRYYHLFINGQYWGVNMTQERISEEYAESYFGGDEDDYDVVKHDRDNNKRYEASEGFNAAWNQIWDTVADQTISATEYEFLEQNVDIDNLIDYVLGNAYEGDLDGATSWFSSWLRANNWYAVRDRVGDRLKWTFFQHDGEHTLGARPTAAIGEIAIGPHAPFNGQSNQFFSKDYMNPYWLHSALANNLEYQQRFKDRVAQVFAAGGVLSNEQALDRWLIRKAQVEDAMLAHSARWGDSKRPDSPRTIDDWQAEVNLVENTIFADRAEIVFDQLLNIGLASDIELPSLSIAPGTVVQIGTFLDIGDLADGTIYYTLDGSDPRAVGGTPSASAQQLADGELIEIGTDTNLKIRVFKDGEWSTILSADYLLEIQAPELSIMSGAVVPVGTSVQVTSSPPGEVYYTLDGSDPLASDGSPIDGAILLNDQKEISVNSDIQVRLRTFYNGRASTLVAADYFVPVQPPTLSIESGATVAPGTSLQVTSPSGGTIYYTLDGSDPLTQSGEPAASAIALVSGDEIEIESDIELKLRVFKDGLWSALVSAEYKIEEETCFVIKAANDNTVVICF